MKKLIIALLLLLVVAYFGYNYLYQDHRDIESEKPEFIVSSQHIINEFVSDANTAEKKYLNKTIEISGSITEINDNDITLNNAVFCAFDVSVNNVQLNSNVTVKGRLIGYDDLLEVIKLDQTTIKK